MSPVDWIILGVVAVCFVLAVISCVKNRKKGCCRGCSGNCSECMKKSDK